jgi:hypothetical protein
VPTLPYLYGSLFIKNIPNSRSTTQIYYRTAIFPHRVKSQCLAKTSRMEGPTRKVKVVHFMGFIRSQTFDGSRLMFSK